MHNNKSNWCASEGRQRHMCAGKPSLEQINENITSQTVRNVKSVEKIACCRVLDRLCLLLPSKELLRFKC